MFTLVSLMGDPKSKPKTPEALWELPGDEMNKETQEDELKEYYNRFKNERSRNKV
jgi:hypothetical protein